MVLFRDVRTRRRSAASLAMYMLVPADVERIENRLERHGFAGSRAHTRAGEALRLCPDDRYSHRRRYEVLRQANPGIALPQKVNRFRRRPG
jgi:hypothetical protein